MYHLERYNSIAYWKIAGETGDYKGGKRPWHVTAGKSLVKWQLPWAADQWMQVFASACGGAELPASLRERCLRPAVAPALWMALNSILCLRLSVFSRKPKGLFRNFIKPGGDVQRRTGTRSNAPFFSPFCREQQSFLCPLSSIIYYQGPEVAWLLSSSWVPSQMTHWI